MGKNRTKKGKKAPLPVKPRTVALAPFPLSLAPFPVALAPFPGALAPFPVDDPADEIEEVEISSDESADTPPQWPFGDHTGLVDFIKNNHFVSNFEDDPDIMRVRAEYMEVLNQCNEANLPEHSTAQIKSIIEFYENEMQKAKLDGFSEDEQKVSEPNELLEKLERLDIDVLDKDGALPPDLTDEMCCMIKEKLQLTNEDLEILKEFKMAMESNSFIKILAENNRLEDLDQRISEKMRGITIDALTRIQQSGENFPSTATQEGRTELLTCDRMLDFAADVIIDRRRHIRRINGDLSLDDEEITDHILSTGCQTCREYPTKTVFQTCMAKPFSPNTMWNALLGLPSKDLELNRRTTTVQYIRIVQFATNEDRHNPGTCDLEAMILDFVNPEELDTYFKAMAESLGFINKMQMGDECDDIWHCRVQLSSTTYPWRKVDFMDLATDIGEPDTVYFKYFQDVTCPISIDAYLERTMLKKRGYTRIGPVEPIEPSVISAAFRNPRSMDPSGSGNVAVSSTAGELGETEDDGVLKDVMALLDDNYSITDFDSDDDQALTYDPARNVDKPHSCYN